MGIFEIGKKDTDVYARYVCKSKTFSIKISRQDLSSALEVLAKRIFDSGIFPNLRETENPQTFTAIPLTPHEIAQLSEYFNAQLSEYFTEQLKQK